MKSLGLDSVAADSTARSRAIPSSVLLGAAALGFALLTWLGARISVPLPLTPVPGSLQTLAALLAGLFLGPRAAAASQAAYLCLGLAGLPVFSLPGAGPAYLFGPTGGYLAGLVAGAWVTGWVFRAAGGGGMPARFVALLSGTAAVYICGLSWLGALLGGDLSGTLHAGLLPFVFFDLAKIVIAAGIHSGALLVGGACRAKWKSTIGPYSES